MSLEGNVNKILRHPDFFGAPQNDKGMTKNNFK